MTTPAYDIVIVGLSLSSAWGNGHATTYRSLLRGLHAEGLSVLFLERDVPWYRDNRDLGVPNFCDLAFYGSVEELGKKFEGQLHDAGAVIVGSYVPEGVAIIDALLDMHLDRLWFYDIDTPVTLGKLERDDEEYLAARQIPQLTGYFSFAGGPALDVLRSVYGARRAEPLYCAVDIERYRPTGEPIVWDMGYLGTYSPDRQPGLETLLLNPARRLPHMRFVVAGPQYPVDIDWPENVERIEHLPPSQHASFYSRQRFTLNLTRQDMTKNGWSPSVRLFEAAACAVPVISDTWPGIEDFFPNGSAIILAHDSGDVVSHLLERDEGWRQSVGVSARRRVLAGHTGRHRARELVEYLEIPANRSQPRRGGTERQKHLGQGLRP